MLNVAALITCRFRSVDQSSQLRRWLASIIETSLTAAITDKLSSLKHQAVTLNKTINVSRPSPFDFSYVLHPLLIGAVKPFKISLLPSNEFLALSYALAYEWVGIPKVQGLDPNNMFTATEPSHNISSKNELVIENLGNYVNSTESLSEFE